MKSENEAHIFSLPKLVYWEMQHKVTYCFTTQSDHIQDESGFNTFIENAILLT